MTDSARGLALVFAGIAFAAFVLVKLLLPARARRRVASRARERIGLAKQRASDSAASLAERASALREAALLALEELRRPGLAASYARRAERLDPEHPEAVGLLATSLRRASRFMALEHLLWRKLSEAALDSPGYQRALRELIDLYAGPLKRPDIAVALRRMNASLSV